MAGSEVSVTVSISEEDAKRLNEAFRNVPAAGQSEMEAAQPLVEALTAAGFHEYLLYVGGGRVPGGVRELRELRLWLLAKYLPGNLPSDSAVAALFHLTSAQARNLVAGTRARYPDEFVTLLEAAARTALREAEEIDEATYRITASGSLAAFLLDLLAESVVPPPLKRADASRRYDLSPDTAKELCARLGMEVGELASVS